MMKEVAKAVEWVEEARDCEKEVAATKEGKKAAASQQPGCT